MNKTLQYVAFLLLLSQNIFGQDYQEISTANGYNQQAYVSLSQNTQTQVANTAWDIAFDISSQQTAGVFMNESGGLINGQSAPRLMVYDAKVAAFDKVPVIDTFLKYELLNLELSWKNDGAFNLSRSKANPFDFGWGVYNPAAFQVDGSKVFAIAKRNGSYIKFMINKLDAVGYTFTYANLDGTNSKTVTLKKADYAGKPLVHFSFDKNDFVTVFPSYPVDFIYQRYVTQLFDVASNSFINYTLTGILNGPNVKAAKIFTADQAGAKFETYKDSLKTELDVIGHDWKAFGGASWTVPTDRVYFIKTADNSVYKIFFIDFEGSSTGTAVLQKEKVVTTAIDETDLNSAKLGVCPNPTAQDFDVTIDNAKNEKVALQLMTINNQAIWKHQYDLPTGLNVIHENVGDLSNGIYILQINIGNKIVSKKLSVIK